MLITIANRDDSFSPSCVRQNRDASFSRLLLRAHVAGQPVVVHVFDGGVLQELAENEELFDVMVNDFFTEFDEDEGGQLTRGRDCHSPCGAGAGAPGSKPEADALLSRDLESTGHGPRAE